MEIYNPYGICIYGQTSTWPLLIELLDKVNIEGHEIDWV